MPPKMFFPFYLRTQILPIGSYILDVTKSGNGEPGTGNGERESGNECTAVIPIRIQNRLFNAA